MAKEWKEISTNPKMLENFTLLNELGILEFIEDLIIKEKESDELMVEAYNVFTKESVDEVISYLVECISDKFIPTDLVFILNEGTLGNRVKTITYKNLSKVESKYDFKSLEHYENFFNNYPETVSYSIMKFELGEDLCTPFENYNSEIIVPIRGHSDLYGVIIIGPKILGKDYTNREIAYLNKLMKFISISMQNNIHYDNSVKDAKTGLYNHNFFISRVNEEIYRSKRNKSPFSLIIMDIDHFKHFNDTYGHLAGDEVIIAIAEELKHRFRESDIISRFGGEEFTVLCPDTGSKDALMLGERIREAVESLNIEYEGQEFNVKISVGLCTYNIFEKLSGDELLKRADEALYQSKEAGRNRVTVYRSGLLHRASLYKNRNLTI